MPTIVDIVQEAVAQALRETWTVSVCVVRAKNGDGTVDVLPTIQRPIETSEGSWTAEELPVLPNVPIAFIVSAGVEITFPVEVGDTGIILHTTYSLSTWRQSADGTASVDPIDQRTHHPASAIYLPGLSVAALAPGYAADPDTVIKNKTGNFRVESAGLIKFGSNSSPGDFAALASKVDNNNTAIAAILAVAVKSDLTPVPTFTPVPVGSAKVAIE